MKMKAIAISFAVVLVAISNLPWCSAAKLRGRHSGAPNKIVHLNQDQNRTSQTEQDDQNSSALLPMRATTHGICMYTLPPQFNIGLLDSVFQQPVPQPMNISPSLEPPLQGLFDTNQFALERIFYDRMQLAATELKPASECVMFYVPYFVAWETSSTNNVWMNAHRPALDAELFTHLSHFNSSGLPGRNHFIVVGRISENVGTFLNNGLFEHMVKLVLEDSDPGHFTNVFAVPYPTWFRYDPSLEGSPADLAATNTIQVHSASQHFNALDCNPNWLGDLTARIAAACNGRSSCSFLVSPDETAVAPAGQVMCPLLDVFGKYSCGGVGAPLTFKTVPQQNAAGHAVVLSCNRGPCWLWGACSHPGQKDPAGQKVRSGPLATIIGSARPKEYERVVLFDMCRKRPSLCAVFDTGQRENSSTFVHSRIPDMYQLLMASTFCINPPGDTPSRKGLFDSLVVGCVPVVTSEDSLQHYSFHIPFWRSVSVLVTTEQLFSPGFNLFDYLAVYAETHPQELWQKQDTIRKAAYSLQYSLAPATAVMRGPDAFDKIIEHMMSRPGVPADQHDFAEVYQIVSASSDRRLYAIDENGTADYQEGFGASAADVFPEDQVWQLRGKGDGSCCYSIVSVRSNRTLYAMVNSTDTENFGASRASEPTWAEHKWRFTAQGDGSFRISNVASGRRIFGETGHNASSGLGATLTQKGSPDQEWKLVPVSETPKIASFNSEKLVPEPEFETRTGSQHNLKAVEQ